MVESVTKKVVEVKRVNERLLVLKMVIDGNVWRIISFYAPQVGRPQIEKDVFWQQIGKKMHNVSDSEFLWVGGDFNGHVGKDAGGFEGLHGGFGYGECNTEGRQLLEWCDEFELAVCNTWFKRSDDRRVTYMSGKCRSEIDYVVMRQSGHRDCYNVKVVKGEECVQQHGLAICDLKAWRKEVAKRKLKEKVKAWKLKDKVYVEAFQEGLCSKENDSWTEGKNKLMKVAENIQYVGKV